MGPSPSLFGPKRKGPGTRPWRGPGAAPLPAGGICPHERPPRGTDAARRLCGCGPTNRHPQFDTPHHPLQSNVIPSPKRRPPWLRQLQIVGANIDTWLLNIILTDFSESLVEELDALKQMAQEAEDDVPTRWTFCGETLFIKPHGSQRQWRWILHCPSLHLDVGTGKHNHIAGKARLSSAFLWEHGPDVALAKLFAFVVEFYGTQDLRAPSERGPSLRRCRGLGAQPR